MANVPDDPTGMHTDPMGLTVEVRRVQPYEARKAYHQAVQWLESNQEALEKDKEQGNELRRFRTEAEQVLELTRPE